MGNIGYSALIIALLISFCSIGAFIAASRNKSTRIFSIAQICLIAVSSLVTLSVLILVIAIFSHNFQLEYVASYTSLNTSPVYLISALWAGNSGSLLFWAWLLSIFSLVVFIQKKDKAHNLMSLAGMVLMVTEAFFILLVIITNPFKTLSVVPSDGYGLNPMLENMGMVLHPPALLAGYVAFTIPFAFAISALLNRNKDAEWLTVIRRWTLAAWLLLGIGNLIGAWWAYVELGWGGYWAWDPVENAGLMPWLLATAFLHSSIMQRRKGTFKTWNLLLIIFIFCLVIFGTFLTRSGILSSVHTFNDAGMTPYFITFLVIALFGSIGLVYYRYDDIKESETGYLVSRDSAFILNNVLLVGSTVVILLGTIFPTLSELIRGVKVNLASSFFNKVNGPIFLGIILLAGICTLISWQHIKIRRLLQKIIWPLLGAIVIAITLSILAVNNPLAVFSFSVCGFVLLSILSEWFREVQEYREGRRTIFLTAFWNILRSNSQRYGGYIVHFGIVLIGIGVIGSSFFSVKTDATLNVGESAKLGNYTITYNGLHTRETPDKSIVSADLSIYESGKLLDQLVSEKYFHKTQEQPVTEVGIRSSISEDVYIILQTWRDNGNVAVFQILINPLVIWIWVGGGVFLLGGLITFWPNKRKRIMGESFARNLSGSVESNTDIEEQILKIRQQKAGICPQCKSKNPPDSRFCSKCGKSLSSKGKDNG